MERIVTAIVASILFCIVVLVGLIIVVLLATDIISWLSALIIIGATILVAWLTLWSLRCYLNSVFERTADQLECDLNEVNVAL